MSMTLIIETLSDRKKKIMLLCFNLFISSRIKLDYFPEFPTNVLLRGRGIYCLVSYIETILNTCLCNSPQ